MSKGARKKPTITIKPPERHVIYGEAKRAAERVIERLYESKANALKSNIYERGLHRSGVRGAGREIQEIVADSTAQALLVLASYFQIGMDPIVIEKE